MRKVDVNYRVKLGMGFIFNEPLYALLEGKVNKNDVDVQIIREDGQVVKDFSNHLLEVSNSFEGHVKVIFKGNVKDRNLSQYFFKGSFFWECEPMILSTINIFDYVLYVAHDNTFYFTKSDLGEFSLEFFLEAEALWQMFIEYYSLVLGMSSNASIESVSLSEDGRVCKIKTKGFYINQMQDEAGMRLNRILPS